MPMAVQTITAAQVTLLSNHTPGSGRAAEEISRGQWVYIEHNDDDNLYLASAEALVTANCVGVALNDVKKNGRLLYAQSGSEVDPGFTVTVGESYVLADDGAGGEQGNIAVIGEAAGENAVKVYLGVGKDANTLQIFIHNSRVFYA